MSINTSRLGLAVAGVAVAVLGATANANASANDGCGAYCPSNVGSPSGNGNGNAAEHAPAAGTKGKADAKNPPGQAFDGTDHNNGYECDGNSGVGKSNPAHTGCEDVSTVASGDVS
jgi:hypothetical protein